MAASPSPRGSKVANARRTTAKQRRHQHVLDVSVRTTYAAHQRKRQVLRWTAKLLLIVGVGAGIFFGIRQGVALLLLKNPDYNLAELNVETDGVLVPEAVIAASGLQKGSNIFLINLDRAKTRIETIPQVEKVQVVRQPPHRITIQINERKPVAWIAPEHLSADRDSVAKSPGSYLVDAHSILLPAENFSSRSNYLPIIRNYHGPRSTGQEVEGEEMRAALDLIHAQEDSMIAARFQIQEIDLAKQFGLEVTDRNGLRVLFGLDDMERQLKRLDASLQVLDQGTRKPLTINLLVQKNVPVTFVTEPTVVAPSPVTPPVASTTPSSAKTVTSGKANSPTGSKDNTHVKAHPVGNGRRSQRPKHGLQPFGASQ